MITNLYM